MSALDELEAEVVRCRRCPRLVAWREEVARVKRAAFADQEYWGRPLPGFGDPAARVVVLGLAPAAHGGNRTGRIFTGDRSGDWLFAALWRAGFANQPISVSRDDGLRLTRRLGHRGGALRAAGQPADPGRARQLPALVRARVVALGRRHGCIVCLGGFAWDAALRVLQAPRPRPKFGHGVEAQVGDLTLLGLLPRRASRTRSPGG